MTTEESKPMVPKDSKLHHRYETTVEIDLIGVKLEIHDILDCFIGVHESITIESDGQKVEIKGSVRPNGKREVRIYKNGRLVKHTRGSQVVFSEQSETKD